MLAISAFYLVCFNEQLALGKYDWKLLLTLHGIPIVVGIFMPSFDLFGRSRYWQEWNSTFANSDFL